jgi:hypothetical protein
MSFPSLSTASWENVPSSSSSSLPCLDPGNDDDDAEVGIMTGKLALAGTEYLPRRGENDWWTDLWGWKVGSETLKKPIYGRAKQEETRVFAWGTSHGQSHDILWLNGQYVGAMLGREAIKAFLDFDTR